MSDEMRVIEQSLLDGCIPMELLQKFTPRVDASHDRQSFIGTAAMAIVAVPRPFGSAATRSAVHSARPLSPNGRRFAAIAGAFRFCMAPRCVVQARNV